MNRSKSAAFIAALVMVVALSVGFVVRAYSGSSSGMVVENVQQMNVYLPSESQSLVGSELPEATVEGEGGDVFGGAVAMADLVVTKQNFKNGFQVNGTNVMSSARALTNLTGISSSGDISFSGNLATRESYEALTASNTITIAESQKTFYLSGATSTQTLPATSTAIAGAVYRFYVSAAMSGNVTIVTNGGANIIEGTLIVAGAVVDCDAEDTITFVSDGENVGDFFELRTDGVKWYIGASGALTAGKLTCTAT